MNTCFVSSVNRLPGEQQFGFIWSMEEFESEERGEALRERRIEQRIAGGGGNAARGRKFAFVARAGWGEPRQAAPCLAD